MSSMMLDAKARTCWSDATEVPVVWVDDPARLLKHLERSEAQNFRRGSCLRAVSLIRGQAPGPPACGRCRGCRGPWTVVEENALPQPPTGHLEISGEAGDFPSPLENAKHHGVFHQRPQARRLLPFFSEEQEPQQQLVNQRQDKERG